MYEIRIHGRGGQGAVLAGGILATALVLEGKFVVAVPSFGFERRGARNRKRARRRRTCLRAPRRWRGCRPPAPRPARRGRGCGFRTWSLLFALASAGAGASLL